MVRSTSLVVNFFMTLYQSRYIFVYAADGCKEMDFKFVLRGQALANHVIKTGPATSDLHCESKCYMDDRCISYNFGTSADGQSNICELSDSDHLMHPENVVGRPDVIYRSAQNTCTCRGNQYCSYNFITNEGICLCEPGYTGPNCETNIDDCASSPCLNQGNCVDKVNSFECDCPSGFSGEVCETDARNCENTPKLCKGDNVRCKTDETNNSYICKCNEGDYTYDHQKEECIMDG